jgi:hypothetical protein
MSPAPGQNVFDGALDQRRWRLLTKSSECGYQVADWSAVVQRWGVGLFAEFLALGIHNHRNVEPVRRLGAKGLVNLLLLGR